VLWSKTSRALEQTGAWTLVLGGGVSASIHIRRFFAERIATEHPDVELRIPVKKLTTDNAIMIGMAGYYHALRGDFADPAALVANGNLSLS
jgi:N6-L-threonylcarbamoyladenine synthase